MFLARFRVENPRVALGAYKILIVWLGHLGTWTGCVCRVGDVAERTGLLEEERGNVVDFSVEGM